MSMVLAVDPGREKCGVAVVSPEAVLLRAIVPTAEIGLTCGYLLARHPHLQVIVGDATGCSVVMQAIRQANPEADVAAVPEAFSTLAARNLYAADHPPRGLERLLPAGMRIPPRPVDDYAALSLAQAFLAARH